jgi:hypothetical protein
MLVVGSLFCPGMFILGFLSSTVIYFCKYLIISGLSKPPVPPFKATTIKKLFYKSFQS